nr:MAG TPA: hypothetical protein [Caudoviricetes sp.]
MFCSNSPDLIIANECSNKTYFNIVLLVYI